MAWRRVRRRSACLSAALVTFACLSLAIAVAGLPDSPAAPAPPPPPLECAASTGAELVAALADNAGCATILLDGVVTLHDGDFPGNRDVMRTRDVVLTSVAGSSAGGAAQHKQQARPWATLETSALLSRHIDVPAGVNVTLSDLHIAGGARVVGDAMPAERPLSVFSLFDGAAAAVTRCEVRLAPASCPAGSDADNLAWLRAFDPNCKSAPAPGGGGGVAVTAATLPVDALHLSAEAVAAATASGVAAGRPKAARVMVHDSTLWCTRYAEAGVAAAAGDAGGAAAGRAASLVTARVWTGTELAAALGQTGSRTVLVAADEITLPPPITDALEGPEALIQDREVILRGRPPTTPGSSAGPAASPPRLLIPPVPASPHNRTRQCKQPFLRAGAGGSVTLTGLTLAATDPGCALMPPGPRAVCALNSGGTPFASPLRGALLPAGMAGAEPGGQLSFKDVAIEFEDCTPALAAAAAEIVASAGAGNLASLVRLTAGGDVASGPPPPGDDPAGLVLTCARCAFDCRKPDVTLPTQIDLWNVTVACGSAARWGGGGGGGGRGRASQPGRPVGLDARAAGGEGSRAHAPAVIALAVTMGVASCLAAVAAVVAAVTLAGSRQAGGGRRAAAQAPAVPPAPPAPTAAPTRHAASSSGSGDDDDSARAGRGRRGWVAKLLRSSGGSGRGSDHKPPDGGAGAPEP